MANVNNNKGNYSPPAGMTEKDHRDTVEEILNILEQRKPIGGYKSPHPSSIDLDALQEVVDFLDRKGLTKAKASSPQVPQKPSRGRSRRR